MKKSGHKSSKQQSHMEHELPNVPPALIESFHQLSPAQDREIMRLALARQIDYCNRVKAAGRTLSSGEFMSKSLEIFTETADDFINKLPKSKRG